MDRLLSDLVFSIIGEAVGNIANILGTKHLKVYLLHLQAKRIVKFWNRTLKKYTPSFMSTGSKIGMIKAP